MSLNGGYAMIKYNSTQEELQIAYRSKKPVLFYDENNRSHWAVIEETSTESVDEETQEPITLYEYSYRLIDEASSVVANPTLSGDEATLNGLEVDGTKYKVGGSEVHLYQHAIYIYYSTPFNYETYLVFVTNKSIYNSLDEMFKDILGNRNYNWYPTLISGVRNEWKFFNAAIMQVNGEYRIQYCPDITTNNEMTTVTTISHFGDIVTQIL